MITKRVPFIYSIIVLSLELTCTFLMFFCEKLGNQLDYVFFALFSIPLLPLAIISLVGGLIHLRYPEVKKKATAVVIMGAVAIFYFCVYAICVAFLVGTGHLPYHYLPDGF